MLEHALDYRAREWLVVPVHSMVDGRCGCRSPGCRSPAKHPITRNGLKDGTLNADTITEWWRRYPSANIGVVTGPRSRIFVLDVDPKHGGNQSLSKLTLQYTDFPATVKATTGGGGHHYLFACPTGLTVPNSIGKLGPGLDIRGEGGYVVAPPSTHASGNRYLWAPYCGPDEAAVAEAPAWLVRAITGTTQRRQLRDLHAPRHSWASVLEYGVKEGQRNDAAARIYGYLLWRGLLPSEAAAVLNLWNKRNEPPIDANELDKIIRSITQREVTNREKRHGRLR